MNLPGRLRASTLGDLLGRLHRSRISGTLELREVGGARAGRLHRIHLRHGLVLAVEADAQGEPYAEQGGEPMSAPEVRARLDAMFSLEDACLAFHVASPRPRRPLPAPLGPPDFLHGRPRARDAGKDRGPDGAETHRRQALSTLGLSAGATREEVQRAFKTLALRLHPDRHPGAASEQRAALSAHFARVAQAYHTLIA